MSYDKLDNDELLRVALDAINQDHHADAVTMLKTLLERDPRHVFGTYLLAAEHAQLGLIDRAEAGFQATVELAPDFPVARFQLGQIHLVKGEAAAAKAVLAPLAQLPAGQALSSYARGLIAAADEQLPAAIAALRTGLACEQEIPALASDMQRALANLAAMAGDAAAVPASTGVPATSLYLANYGNRGR